MAGNECNLLCYMTGKNLLVDTTCILDCLATGGGDFTSMGVLSLNNRSNSTSCSLLTPHARRLEISWTLRLRARRVFADINLVNTLKYLPLNVRGWIARCSMLVEIFFQNQRVDPEINTFKQTL